MDYDTSRAMNIEKIFESMTDFDGPIITSHPLIVIIFGTESTDWRGRKRGCVKWAKVDQIR